MKYTTYYHSPLGGLTLIADDSMLTGLWFAEQDCPTDGCDKTENAILHKAKKWLDSYFSGEVPNFSLPVRLTGTTFQNEVWEILQTIPYGGTTTYGDIAKAIAKRHGVAKMSAQAVGNAVGKNKISIIVPCHRVIGANDSLVGYTGGMGKKIALLEIEHSLKID